MPDFQWRRVQVLRCTACRSLLHRLPGFWYCSVNGLFLKQMLCGMMPFTVCALLFVLLFVLMLARTGWRLTPQALLSTVVGWLLLCAVIIGVVYLVVSRRKTKGNGTDGGTERNV